MRTFIDSISHFPRQEMSLLPTPVYKLSRLSQLLQAELYVMRDDLTGFAMGGNKTRKLDYLIADALNRGYDTLLAIGAVQSNFCRIAAAAGVTNGLETHLILGGSPPEKATGNLLLDYLFGAKITFVESENWDDWAEAGQELALSLERKGKKVYFLPVGGSTRIGALGYVRAFGEILDAGARLGVTFDLIMHASSSGGTQAGLIAGAALGNWPGRILGINVARDNRKLEADIYRLALETAAMIGAHVERRHVMCDASYMGEKYGARTEKCEEALELFAREEGIVLDRVYSGKAAAALIDYARLGRLEDMKTLFIHTGGNVELFR